ncbi:MAG: NAD-dependent epimerase/dehydratase family protein [Deltaproteobacteria bacterium]|nr:NAD-dependent epimerase/dehydratase family protein [Deltaproteobacteria bacterium]
MFYKGKVVLVTGGSGFVGSHLVEALLEEGATVRVPVHRRSLAVKDKGVETSQVDLTKWEDCLAVVRDVDYVFHAAGGVGSAAVTALGSIGNITTYLVISANVVNAALAASVERLLLFSSSTVYPAVEYPIKEEEMWNGPPHPSYFGYGWMRRYIERLAEFVAKESALKIALVRPTGVYGPRDNFDLTTCHVIPALIRKAVERTNPYEVWGSGEEIRDFLHVTDLARGCLLMLEKCATCEPVNIGYGKGVTIKEVTAMILGAAGYENARVVFNRSKPTNIPVRIVDISKARNILGFEPSVSLEAGLTDTTNWYMGSKGKTRSSV